MENTEKSIKRWLKKKVKLTLATVVMFLITGTISYSLEITSNLLDNNVWENPKDTTIDEQVTIGKSLLSSGITISNEGTIEIKHPEILEDALKNKAVGNGIGIYDTSYKGKLDINSINNSGIISGKINLNSPFDGLLGNGIGIYGYNIRIPKIVNSGTISGFVEQNYEHLKYAGNGIYIKGNSINISDNSNVSDEGEILNTGDIKGRINLGIEKDLEHKIINDSGNGIIFQNTGAPANKVNSFCNYGNISGSIEINLKNIATQAQYQKIGNGIILSGVRELSLLKNEGKIEGKILESGKKNIADSTKNGNGIVLEYNSIKNDEEIIFESFNNNGIIVGKVENPEKADDYIKDRKKSGNGIVLDISLNSREMGNFNFMEINNSGFIKGTVGGDIEKKLSGRLAQMPGNGFTTYILMGIPENGRNKSLKIENFINNGLIFGKISNFEFENVLGAGTTFGGNGICLFTGFTSLEYGTINNKGVLSGKAENIVSNSEHWKGAGIGIGLYLNAASITGKKTEKGEIPEGRIINEGIIRGEGKGILIGNLEENRLGIGNGIYIHIPEDNEGKIGQIKSSLENKGLISGYFSGSKKEIESFNGTGILININKKKVECNTEIKNIGTILGNKSGIEIYRFFSIQDITTGAFNKKFMTNIYNNYGVIVGEKPVRFIASYELDSKQVDDNFIKLDMADKGYAIVLNEDTTVKEVIGTAGNKNKVSLELFADGTTADYTILNTKISEDEKDAYQEFKDENLTNTIINGVGENSGVVTVKGSSSLENGIINAYKTAVSIGDYSEFKGTNVIINGGGIRGSEIKNADGKIESGETAIIKGTDKNNTLKLAGNVQLNGSIDMGGKDDFDVLSFGEKDVKATTVNIYDEISSAENINVKNNTNMTLYETAKITGTDRLNIAAGSQVTLRVNNLEKDANDGKYKNHALYNDSDKTLFISGDLGKLNNGTTIEETENGKYDNVSVLNIKTNGLGVHSTIALGNVKFNPKVKEDGQANKVDKPGFTQNDTIVWVKTNSILHGAKVNEQLKDGKYDTNITIEAEKDLFSIANKVMPWEEIVVPGKPGGPTTIIPGLPLGPSKPINPDKPNVPSKYENLYVKLNEVYKGIHTSNDRNFNALNDIVTNYTFGDKDKSDYPVVGNEKMQMATLLGYLRSVYSETPYSFSNESTRKSMGLFHDTVRDNNFKAKEDEWLIYGGLVHQSGDQEQTYYGRNYHGFDTGTADTDAEIKLTGAYGQFEYGNTDTLSTGIMVGGTKSDVEVASSKLKGTGAYVGVYAKKDIKDLRLTAGAGYQYTEYDGTRRTINQTYSEDYKDNAFNLYLDGKYSYDLGNNLYLVPKAGLSYTHIDQDGIKESNDKTLALNIDSKEFDVLEGTVGVDIKKVIPTEKGKHSVSAGVSYRHILDGADADYLTADFGGNDFEILVPHKNKGQMSIGVRYEAELENGMFYDVKGNYFMNVDSKENTHKNADRGEWRVGVGIGYKFTTLKELALTSLFDFDKSEIRPEGKEMLKNAAVKLNGRANGTLIIEGHTDSVGSEKYNQTLSEKRANAVEKELKANVTNKKVDYSTKGYGETKPIADNNTEEGRAANRRVELKFNKR